MPSEVRSVRASDGVRLEYEVLGDGAPVVFLHGGFAGRSAFSRQRALSQEYPHIIEGARWVTWDLGKNLWVARPGIVEQYTLDDLRSGTRSYSLDVDQFEPPPKPVEEP